jgi:COMPASS component SWD3
MNRGTPAYYPPRNGATRPLHSQGTNLKPLKVLEGHGDGAVFDVRWCPGEGLLSAGEDGAVVDSYAVNWLMKTCFCISQLG